jgi:hypothetical protein
MAFYTGAIFYGDLLMFVEQCPYCHKDLQISDRFVLIYKLYGTCKHCNQDFLPKRNSMIVSSGVIGAIVGVLGVATLRLDYFSAVGLAIIIVFIVQRFINIFYSLDMLENG